jgi:hypothetical protein
LVASLIAMVALGGLKALGANNLNYLYNTTASAVAGVMNP